MWPSPSEHCKWPQSSLHPLPLALWGIPRARLDLRRAPGRTVRGASALNGPHLIGPSAECIL
eukprot:7440909-Alexandrium_andersonii.AAC.1